MFVIRAASTVRRFFTGLVHAIIEDDVDDLAAMMTYYAIMALFPMVLFVFTLALVVLPADLVRAAAASVTEPLPADVGRILRGQIESMRAASSPWLAILGGVLTLWSASRGASTLTTALNRVFSKKEDRPWLRRQVRAVFVTAVVAVIIVVALGFFLFAPELGHRVAARVDLDGEVFDTAWWILRWVGAGALATFLWSLLYKYLPNTDAPLRVFTPGALIGVALWALVSRGLAMFIDYFSDFQGTYGAFAGAIIFLLWLWLSNLALLIGAEVADVLAAMRAKASPAAAALDDPAEHEEMGQPAAAPAPAPEPDPDTARAQAPTEAKARSAIGPQSPA